MCACWWNAHVVWFEEVIGHYSNSSRQLGSVTALHGKGLWVMGLRREVSDWWLNADPTGRAERLLLDTDRVSSLQARTEGQMGMNYTHGNSLSFTHALSLFLSHTFCFSLPTDSTRQMVIVTLHLLLFVKTISNESQFCVSFIYKSRGQDVNWLHSNHLLTYEAVRGDAVFQILPLCFTAETFFTSGGVISHHMRTLSDETSSTLHTHCTNTHWTHTMHSLFFLLKTDLLLQLWMLIFLPCDAFSSNYCAPLITN